MRQVPIFSVFSVVMSAELGNAMLTPLLTFVFFAVNSPLFSTPTSIAQRSLLFGLCLSLYKLGEVIANIIITTLSDHFGRKIALTATACGLLIIGISGICALTLHQAWLMIAGMFACNLLNTNKAVGPAIMSDISTPQNRVRSMAAIQCVISLGACLGPIISGQLAAYAFPFMLIILIACVNLLLMHRCPETLVTPAQSVNLLRMLRDYRLLLQSKSVRWLFGLLILCQMSWSSYYEFIPPALRNIFHYSPAQTGWFVGLIAFWLIMATSFMIRLLLRYFNYRQLLWISSIAIVLGTLLSLIASENLWQPWSQALLWLSPVPTAMGDVIFFSLFTTFLLNEVASGQQGKAMGLTIIIATLVWSLMALLGGYLLTWRPDGALLFAPCGAVGLLLVLWYSQEIAYDFMSGCW